MWSGSPVHWDVPLQVAVMVSWQILSALSNLQFLQHGLFLSLKGAENKITAESNNSWVYTVGPVQVWAYTRTCHYSQKSETKWFKVFFFFLYCLYICNWCNILTSFPKESIQKVEMLSDAPEKTKQNIIKSWGWKTIKIFEVRVTLTYFVLYLYCIVFCINLFCIIFLAK